MKEVNYQMPQRGRSPIIADEQYSSLNLVGTRTSGGGTTAIVYLNDKGQVTTQNPTLLARSKARFHRYEIDMAHHSETLGFTLPSAEEAFKFRARMYLTWTVHD